MKKVFVITALFTAIMSALAFRPMSGKIVLLVSFDVKNFHEWKKNFDAGGPIREKAGIKVLSVCSLPENENHLMVIEETQTMEAATNFVNILRSKEKAGDVSRLNVQIYSQQE